MLRRQLVQGLAGSATVGVMARLHAQSRLPARPVTHLVASAKKEPGAISHGSTGIGGIEHDLMSFSDRQAMLGAMDFAALERRYA
jgi:tripartite-type tricarboxylate transporter receptor subunit TctC